MLRLIPDADVSVIERCSGHGGSWGVMKKNFDTALKVGRPAARRALEDAKRFVASECPLAGKHIVQGMQILGTEEGPSTTQAAHPIEILARAYGLSGGNEDGAEGGTK
jgi:glycerol-3-phosphate dehydrogenase subunit C